MALSVSQSTRVARQLFHAGTPIFIGHITCANRVVIHRLLSFTLRASVRAGDQCLTNAAAQACAKRKRLAPRRAGERNARSTAGPTSRRALNSISGSRQRSADATRPHLSLGEALTPPPLAIPLVAIQSEYISVPPRHTPRPESPGSFA